MANAAARIGAVGAQVFRPRARASALGAAKSEALDQRFELRCFVSLPRCERNVKRETAPVGEQVELGAEAPAASAQRMVYRLFARAPFFRAPAATRLARMLLPSTQKICQSIFPSSSSFICNLSSILSNTPEARQALKRW